jgi:hypothetical protein
MPQPTCSGGTESVSAPAFLILHDPLGIPILRIEVVAHDREQPRLEIGTLAEGVDAIDRAQQGLLDQIVRAVAIAAERARKGVQTGNGFHHAVARHGIQAHGADSGWRMTEV